MAVLGALASYLAYSSCSTEKATPRDIRAHTRLIQGVSHAEPAAKPGRYCAKCHGESLQGGLAGEPSCYSCHGQNWTNVTTEFEGPGDHTAENQGYHHLPGLFTPADNCVSCHGDDLTGSTASGETRPGCTLCHTKLWEERLPSSLY